MSVGVEIIAKELRENADIVEIRERGAGYIAEIAPKLTVTQWRDFRGQVEPLHGEDPSLWADLTDAYDALERTKRRQTAPPDAETLRKTAKRLERKITHRSHSQA